MLSFFMKNFYLLTENITPYVTNSLWYLHAVQDLDNFLRDLFRNMSNIKDEAFCEEKLTIFGH